MAAIAPPAIGGQPGLRTVSTSGGCGAGEQFTGEGRRDTLPRAVVRLGPHQVWVRTSRIGSSHRIKLGPWVRAGRPTCTGSGAPSDSFCF